MAPTNLRELISEILEKYCTRKNESFKGDPFAGMIRSAPRVILSGYFSDRPDIKIKSSAGQSQWANIPWIAIFNKSETDTARSGVYVVYLFSSDCQRAYLTLNQGVDQDVQELGKIKAREKLRIKAIEIQKKYPNNYFSKGDGPRTGILLSNMGFGLEYENACIYFKGYTHENLPSNDELLADLKMMIELYDAYSSDANIETTFTDFSKYQGGVEEGKKLLVKHYQRERNTALIKKIKEFYIQKYGELKCQVCGFSFKDKYGELGRDFIEAHHKKPIREIKPGEITKIEDIILVCSNCHRMIHRKPSNRKPDMPCLLVEELKEIITR